MMCVHQIFCWRRRRLRVASSRQLFDQRSAERRFDEATRRQLTQSVARTVARRRRNVERVVLAAPATKLERQLTQHGLEAPLKINIHGG